MISTFSNAERRILASLAKTIIPGSPHVPPAGPRTVSQVEEFLSVVPPAIRSGFRGLLWALELRTVPTHGRPFTRLSGPKRLRVLERLVHGTFLHQQALRALAATIKAAHFHDRALFEAVGSPFEVEPPAQVDQPRYLSLVQDGRELTDDDEIECDVVVVGTGAGGAAAAATLAQRGLAVVMLEEGGYFDRRQFTGNTIAMQRMLYRDFGGIFALGNVPIVVPLGRAVGGTTVINSGTCLRPPPEVLESWVRDHGLTELSPDALAPYVAEVEELLGVAPNEARYLGDVAKVIARGCDALGLDHGPLPRNAPDCDAQARCQFGCPTDAKRSTNISYVPAALRANAYLFTRTTAREVLLEQHRAVGVLARTQGGATLRVRARATVLACGALLTPQLLMRQGLGNRSLQLGRNLTIHPAMGLAGEMDAPTDVFSTVPQGYAIKGFFHERLLFEGGSPPPDLVAAATHDVGPKFMDFAEAMHRLILFGFAVKDTSHGQVVPGAAGRPLITYWLNHADLERMRRGVEILTRVYLAAGARRVHLPIRGHEVISSEAELGRFLSARLRARDLDLTAYHPLGTTRMGRDPWRSVVGADHQVHDVPDLYICDGGAIPSSLGVNPQITIMAMALRAAGRLADKLDA